MTNVSSDHRVSVIVCTGTTGVFWTTRIRWISYLGATGGLLKGSRAGVMPEPELGITGNVTGHDGRGEETKEDNV